MFCIYFKGDGKLVNISVNISKFIDVGELCMCTFCLQERETMQLVMSTCMEVNAVWSSVEDVIRERLNVTLQLSIQEIILGFYPDKYDCSIQIAKAIQRLVLIVKWYIHMQM